MLVKIYTRFAGQYLPEVKALQLYPRYVTPRRVHKESKMRKHAKISKYRTMQKQTTEHHKIEISIARTVQIGHKKEYTLSKN